ncbi:MAG: hypothetical protein F4X08_12340 [Gemmatimonadetes bacterium]|nr:hypothetical protein [Gemmatimonadota bacterium]MYD26591.1 hypothetical protein [Gemmatimonadota bacterium]MYI99511.1 hypothetical protein [Gemmatimonadota bacterium]
MKTLGVLLCLLFLAASFPGPAAGPGPAAVPAAGPSPAAVPAAAPAAVPSSAAAPAHVFYVSIARVKWNADDARLDISVRIFTDDLEEAIVAKGGPRLRLWTDQAHADRDRHVAEYLASRLAFRVNGVDRQLTYAGIEDALDATACLVQITGVDRVETIEVENRILIEMFDTQANVMRFEIGGEKKYVNLSKKTVTGTVRFGA